MKEFKRYLFVHIQNGFVAPSEKTGKPIVFKTWRTNVVEVFAYSLRQAKQVAALTGIEEGKHYHDVLRFVDYA